MERETRLELATLCLGSRCSNGSLPTRRYEPSEMSGPVAR